MGRALVIVALGGLAFAGFAAACVSLSGLAGEKPASLTEGGPPTDAMVTGDADSAPDPCDHTTFPPPPAKDDDPKTELPAIVLAVRTASLNGLVDGHGAGGFDLDGVCTCFGDPKTAHGGQPSCVAPDGGAPSCDGEGGVDHQLVTLVAGYPDLFSTRTDVAGPNLVFEITKYNGRANDAEVFVAAVGSPGIYERDPKCDVPGGTDAGGDAGAPPYVPAWQGCDRWAIDEQYVLPGTSSPVTFLPAYVTDHVLVIPPSSKPVIFQVSKSALPLSGAIVTGTLVALDDQLSPIVPAPEVGTRFRIEAGVLAGRSTTTDALRAFAATQAAADGGPLCGFPSFFDAVKTTFVCPNTDIASDPAKDFTGATCDAISLSTAFNAQPAAFGSVRKPPKPPCSDPADPSNDAFFDCSR